MLPGVKLVERKSFVWKVSMFFEDLLITSTPCYKGTLLLSYLHIVLYWVEGLHDEDAGHVPEPWWVSYTWCALRCWFTQCPVEMPGPQSFLHSWRHVCHEHGGGGPPPPPPQDNTPPRVLARTRTNKTRGSVISLRKERSKRSINDFATKCRGRFFKLRFGLNDS